MNTIKYSRAIIRVSMDVMSDVSVNVSVTVIRGRCDECLGHVLYSYLYPQRTLGVLTVHAKTAKGHFVGKS
jgi:hypothetical protein